MKKSFFTIIFLTVVTVTAFSQSEYQPIDFTFQLKSMHLDRGFPVTSTPITGINLWYQSENKKFKAGVWGGTGSTGEYRELDHYMAYSCHGFKVELWDIYNFSTGATYNNKEFFNYKASETGHFVDFRLGYKFAENFPLSVLWSTFIYGRDRGKLNQRNIYSTYTQLGYTLLKKEPITVDVFVAGVFALHPEKGSAASIYISKSDLVNLSLCVTKTLKAAGFDISVSAMPAWNPGLNRGNIQLALSVF